MLTKKDKVFSINKQKNTLSVKITLEETDLVIDSIIEQRESFSSRSSLTSLPSQCTDKAKFHMHLLQVAISCEFSLIWINNPEVIELFKFFNLQIKLLDQKILSNEILDEVVKEFDNRMLEKLVLDQIGISEQELMEMVLTSSDG
ncbi:hypothetical protein GLOIN_2v1884899 [Rhizophagus clarus]|uniref:Uncharacterized protein n=1 Tax=Rhizophagus clarus TaxID=94130 RepID=A0A8H3M434_9GLOM|nr:hypothetical protein GLOIN_2v1884899 [Rhizophagus clarus]